MLTEDHPERLQNEKTGTAEPRGLNPLLRGLAFLGVFVLLEIVASMIIAVGRVVATGNLKIFETDDIHSLVTLFDMLAEVVSAIIGYLVVVYGMEYRSHPFEFRLGRWKGLMVGIVIGFVAIGLCVGVLAITGNYRIVGLNTHYNPWIDIISMGICAGVAEEIMMRGMLLRLVEEWLGSWGALAVSALVFGLIHLTNQDGSLWGGLAIAIEDGILAAALYFVTRSLWVCIGEHAMWNVAEGPIFGSIVSGNGKQDSWLVAQWSGPDILTGGSFGLEASIVPVILMGAAGIALMVYAHRKGMLVQPVWVRRRMENR
ncbi:CPBP family intramembrane metalloprotease [Bifidobacterium sp. ESL0728]|uniref:CPBP family intramembrane glutamic endopeptidase n=1 Tax=Bifidobacterium sp. ESL0728 TaxID=2983220 RepID=UPI0023F988AF|nr:CPBP family intramembrane glutamic endopeptidase [Bifidobacterium sp. ESL0728]WEV59413.1 CPBP family intramembrane metalloprotease [Bifidobacterium sp. ESL0728]